jgi:hypothetical protein
VKNGEGGIGGGSGGKLGDGGGGGRDAPNRNLTWPAISSTLRVRGALQYSRSIVEKAAAMLCHRSWPGPSSGSWLVARGSAAGKYIRRAPRWPAGAISPPPRGGGGSKVGGCYVTGAPRGGAGHAPAQTCHDDGVGLARVVVAAPQWWRLTGWRAGAHSVMVCLVGSRRRGGQHLMGHALAGGDHQPPAARRQPAE